MKIKISLLQNVEESTSRDNSPLPARYQSKHKRYLYLFVCLGVFISAIKLPRIPTYLLKIVVKRLFAVHTDFINCNYLSTVIVITDFRQFFNLFEISIAVVRYIEFFPFFFIAYFYRAFFGFFPIFNPSSPPLHKHLLQTAFFEFF